MESKTKSPSLQKLKISDIINLTSAFLAALGTGIVYFEGWFYASSWYGFFSIDLSQIQIPIQVVLINGLPSTVMAILVILISIGITAILNKHDRLPPLNRDDIPVVSLISLILFFLLVIVFRKYLTPIYPSVGDGILLVPEFDFDITGFGLSNEMFFVLVVFAFVILVVLIIARAVARKSVFHVSKAKKRLAKSSSFLHSINQMWLLGVGVLILIYFYFPLALSSELGQMDAIRGRHFMNGNKNLPIAEIHSDSPIAALLRFEKKEALRWIMFMVRLLLCIVMPIITFLRREKRDKHIQRDRASFIFLTAVRKN